MLELNGGLIPAPEKIWRKVERDKPTLNPTLATRLLTAQKYTHNNPTGRLAKLQHHYFVRY